MRRPGALLLAGVALAAQTALADVRGQYLLHCGGCHLADGSGNPPEVPSLIREPGSIASVPGGRAYLVQVPGAAQAPVSDALLAEIVSWILAEFSADTLAADFEPLSEAEVHAARQEMLADPLKRRAEIWRPYDH